MNNKKEQYDSLYVSVTELNEAMETELYFPVELSKEDLSPVPNVKEIKDLGLYLNAYDGGEDSYVVKTELIGTMVVVHADLSEEEIPLKTEDYLELSSDAKNSDIILEKNKFDFLPAIKAIIYASAPKEEADIDYKKDGGDLYQVYTEEEYQERHQQEDEEEATYRPFRNLKRQISAKERKEENAKKKAKKPAKAE